LLPNDNKIIKNGNHEDEDEDQYIEPYIGPRPYRRDIKDQSRFFGRDDETDEILALITSHRVILVYAQSGAGKTSIFNAQVIPSLRDHGFEVLPMARVKITSTIPISPKYSNNNISSQIKNIYIYNAMQVLLPEIDPQSFLDMDLFEFLDKYFPIHKDENGEMQPQVLIFDQLEELFSFYPDRWIEQQKDFFQEITDSLDNNPLLRIVFIIREDFLGQLDPFRSILPEKLSPHFRLERLRRKESILAIKGPLQNILKSLSEDKRKNIESEINALVHDLLKINVETPDGKIRQLEGEFVEPIQLQVVCKRWWNERNEAKKVSLEDLGNVDKALEDFYQDAVFSASKQTAVHEKDIRTWCEEELITSSGTRSIVHRGHNSTGGIDNKVVDSLENKYLVRRELRSGASWYELTHDRLIKPIKDSNKEWFDKKQKSKIAFQIKIFVPIILISIIGIFIYFLALQTNIQEQREEILGSKNALFSGGLSSYKIGQYSDAVDFFNQVLQIEPNNVTAQFLKGSSLYEAGNYIYAHESFKQVLQIDLNNTNVLYYNGLSLYNLERYNEAIAAFNRVLAIEPTNKDTLLYKGLSLYNLERYNEALAYYDMVIEIDPNNINATKEKEKIQQLQQN
jgi:tetratricopeptide (TPR) repeat protein